jgi:hypothetical protein
VNTSCLLPPYKQDPHGLPDLRIRRSKNAAKAPNRNFKVLFCHKFNCPPQEYENQVFSRCLHRHALPWAGLLRRLNPDFFREDDSFIADLATATSHKEVVMELNRFHGRNVRDRNWLRKKLSLRISGKRVQRLSRRLFRAL